MTSRQQEYEKRLKSEGAKSYRLLLLKRDQENLQRVKDGLKSQGTPEISQVAIIRMALEVYADSFD